MEDAIFYQCHNCGKIFTSNFTDVKQVQIGYADTFADDNESKISPARLEAKFFCDDCFRKLQKKA